MYVFRLVLFHPQHGSVDRFHGWKDSVSLGRRLVRGVYYVGFVLFHPWYRVQEH